MSDLPAQVLCELRDLIREKFPLRILGGKTEAAMLVDRIDAALAELAKAEGRSAQ